MLGNIAIKISFIGALGLIGILFYAISDDEKETKKN